MSELVMLAKVVAAFSALACAVVAGACFEKGTQFEKKGGEHSTGKRKDPEVVAAWALWCAVALLGVCVFL